MPLPVTHEIMVDWDMTDWAATPDFTQGIDDISDDIMEIRWIRGKETEEGNSPAATLELRIKPNQILKYSPCNVGSVLAGKLLPWRVVRVRSSHNTIVYNEFFGFISRIRVDPHPDRPQISLYITDGIDLLARQTLTQDQETVLSMNDGEAIGAILDVAGWSATRRDIDVDGGVGLLGYPAVSKYEVG